MLEWNIFLFSQSVGHLQPRGSGLGFDALSANIQIVCALVCVGYSIKAAALHSSPHVTNTFVFLLGNEEQVRLAAVGDRSQKKK